MSINEGMAETREKFNLKVPFPLGLLSPLSSLSGRVTYLKGVHPRLPI